jgi:hypothetical protein
MHLHLRTHFHILVYSWSRIPWTTTLNNFCLFVCIPNNQSHLRNLAIATSLVVAIHTTFHKPHDIPYALLAYWLLNFVYTCEEMQLPLCHMLWPTPNMATWRIIVKSTIHYLYLGHGIWTQNHLFPLLPIPFSFGG